MTLTTPDWLTRHGGTLRAAPHGDTWYVFFGEEPQYVLMPRPAGGKHVCAVMQTINGKRLDGGGTYATREEACSGGLEELRKSLGW